MRFVLPPHSLSRRTNFWIFPVDVLGRSPNSTAAGALKWAMCCLQNSMISPSVAAVLRKGRYRAGELVQAVKTAVVRR